MVALKPAAQSSFVLWPSGPGQVIDEIRFKTTLPEETLGEQSNFSGHSLIRAKSMRLGLAPLAHWI